MTEYYKHDESDRLRGSAKAMLVVCLAVWDRLAIHGAEHEPIAEEYLCGVDGILEEASRRINKAYSENLRELNQ